MPLTAIQLDVMAAAGCQNPKCKHKHEDHDLFISQRCHPAVGVKVSYQRGSGVLKITCAECEREIVQVAVKPS